MTYPQPGQPAWQQPAPQYEPQPPKKRRRWPWITLGVLVLFIVVIAVTTNNGTGTSTATSTSTPSTSGNSTPGQVAATAAVPITTEPAATTTVNTPSVPPQEQEAIGAAQQYLSFTAFSRDGLINQLSSKAGDGYPADVATAAVDSLGEDWNVQAAKSAQEYLNLSPFSCSGLIHQLDSSAGDKYTVAQATYGAHQTSACG